MLYVWEPSLPPLMIYLCIPDSISSANICKYMMVSNKKEYVSLGQKQRLLKGYDALFIPYLFLKYKIAIVFFLIFRPLQSHGVDWI